MLAQTPIIPTTGTCRTGQSSILQMDSVFQSLSSNLQAEFQSAHDTIMSSYNSTWFPGIDWIPWDPSCGIIGALGVQADGLTAQMQSAEGQIPVGVGGPASTSQQSLLPSLFGGQGTAVLLIGTLIFGYLLLKR